MTKLKKFPLAITLGLVATTIGGASLVSANSHSSNGECISQSQAQAIALKDCGASQNQVTFVKVAKEKQSSKAVYVVDFCKGQTEYDYTIDAQKGNIEHKDNDIDNYDVSQSSGATNPTGSAPGSNSIPSGSSNGESSSSSVQSSITAQEAKEIALSHAGSVETQVNSLEVQEGEDNDQAVFEVEFDCQGKEYSYTISASDGTILDIDNDEEDDDEGDQDSHDNANYHDDCDDDEDLNDEYE